MNAPAAPQQIGTSVRRKEDYRFLTGAGQYTDDIATGVRDVAMAATPHRLWQAMQQPRVA